MNALRAIWKDGHVLLQGQADWPEGMRLTVQPEPIDGLDFMTEEEQGDDPESIRRWIEETNALPAPAPPDPVEEAEWKAWTEKVKAYNIEAVRRQFLDEQQ